MTQEQDAKLQEILQQSLDLTEALKTLEDTTESNGGGLHILLSWAVEKATKLSNDIDGFLMDDAEDDQGDGTEE